MLFTVLVVTIWFVVLIAYLRVMDFNCFVDIEVISSIYTNLCGYKCNQYRSGVKQN